jgi:lipopolysaccharide/colanic/teichoic acid biosynthesis glycosyltransferase
MAASPLMALIAILIKLDSRGPVLFRQDAWASKGEHFGMLKFRSMVVDAEERLTELAHRNEGSGVLFKIKDDPEGHADRQVHP